MFNFYSLVFVVGYPLIFIINISVFILTKSPFNLFMGIIFGGLICLYVYLYIKKKKNIERRQQIVEEYIILYKSGNKYLNIEMSKHNLSEKEKQEIDDWLKDNMNG
jgi:hypothetical protein